MVQIPEARKGNIEYIRRDPSGMEDYRATPKHLAMASINRINADAQRKTAQAFSWVSPYISRQTFDRPRPFTEKTSAPREFKLVAFDEISLSTETGYLIKDILPRVGLTVIWGPPKCGKSFKALDMFMSVARNAPYRDYKVKGGPVVYVSLEGEHGFKKRVIGYKQNCMKGNEGPVPFYLIGGSMDLVKDHAALLDAIRAQIGDVMPVADRHSTLNRSLVGSELSDEDMGDYIKAVDAVRDAFECSVTIIHHCGHDASRPRGHTSLFGAVDCLISVKRDGGNNIVTTVQHMKDGEAAEPMVDRLESVEVGTDDMGTPSPPASSSRWRVAPSWLIHGGRDRTTKCWPWKR